MENEFCPCCGRHCPLTNPSCKRGENYAQSGGQPLGTDEYERGKHVPHEHCHGHGEHGHRHGHGEHGHRHNR